MNIYKVKPNVPVYYASYFVLAESYNDAAEQVLKRENRSDADCQGIEFVQLCEPFDQIEGFMIGFRAA